MNCVGVGLEQRILVPLGTRVPQWKIDARSSTTSFEAIRGDVDNEHYVFFGCCVGCRRVFSEFLTNQCKTHTHARDRLQCRRLVSMSKQQMEKWRNRYGQAPAPAPAAEAAGSEAPQPVSRRRRHIAEAMKYADDTKDDLPPIVVQRALEQARKTVDERRARDAEFLSGQLTAYRNIMSEMDRQGEEMTRRQESSAAHARWPGPSRPSTSHPSSSDDGEGSGRRLQGRREQEPLHEDLGGGCRGRRTLGCAVRR